MGFDTDEAWHWGAVGGAAAVVAAAAWWKRDKVVGVLLLLYVLFAFWTSAALVLMLQALARVTVGLVIPEKRRHRMMNRIQQLIIFNTIVLNPFWSVKVEKKGKVPRGGIVMSNHLSYIDAFSTATALFPRYAPKYASGQFVFKLPLLGPILTWSGHLKVANRRMPDGTVRADRSKTGELMEKAKAYLADGDQLVVFPEGRLSFTGDLLEFRDGFFRLAFETGAPIVPMAQWGNHDLFPPGQVREGLARPGTIRVALGDPIDPSDFADFQALKAHVRQAIETLRNNLSNYPADRKATADIEAPAI